MKNLKNITLELSLKPFKSTDSEYINKVCNDIAFQWLPLLKHTDIVSIMLWSSDGSEILEYKGNPDEEFEWAKYIGGAVRRMTWNKDTDPDGIGLHTTNYLYTQNPPIMTYKILKKIIKTFKEVIGNITGKHVRVGATFDPGPEFAKSPFKYERHNEICIGESMGRKSMVCSYSLLNEDDCQYAGFPDGIRQDTPFGTFFGRQCQHFLTDLEFDYIWLSNGFGFGTETWGITGAIFDGNTFNTDKIPVTQNRILEFWKLFRQECTFRVETRGTNLSTGIDLATDAVNLKGIYEGDFDILPPPNSPWAAIDGDFGLELAGYMSRIAKLPGDNNYLFRFYIHDPWWMNSPWIDRYEGRPHDIYLPLAISRINRKGLIERPENLNFLTIDNSFGEMPESCPNEIIPHIVKAYEQFPDDKPPLLWVYPFEEYNDYVYKYPEKMFFEDWYIRGAINDGLILSGVAATNIFCDLYKKDNQFFNNTTIVTPVPIKESKMNKILLNFIKSGGKAILYGSLSDADESVLDVLNIRIDMPIRGELEIKTKMLCNDEIIDNSSSQISKFTDILTDGGLDTVIRDKDRKGTVEYATGCNKSTTRTFALSSEYGDGIIYWVRGTDCSKIKKEKKYFSGESIIRAIAGESGYRIQFTKNYDNSKSPVIMLHRNKNAFIFSGYTPDTTCKIKFQFPLGMPLLVGYETTIENGYSTYCTERAWRAECRIFIEQKEKSVISCKEFAPVSYQMRRRLEVSGLKNAKVRILTRTGYEGEKTHIVNNSHHPFVVGEPISYKYKNTSWGEIIETGIVSGTLMISDRYC